MEAQLHARLKTIIACLLAFVLAGCVSRQTGTVPRAESAVVGVVMREFEFEPRPLVAKAGRVRFQLMNRGSVEHDFMITELMMDMEHDRDLVQPGQSKTIEVDLKPGVYEVVCTVPGHKEAGMKVTIKVNS